MTDDNSNVIEVLVPEDASTPAAFTGDATNPTGSTSVTEEVIDVILDPIQSADGAMGSAATPEGVVEEVVVVEPGVDATGTDDTGTDNGTGSATGTGTGDGTDGSMGYDGPVV